MADDAQARARGTTRTSRGLAGTARGTGAAGRPSRPRRWYPTDFYDEHLNFLATWRRFQRGWQIRTIKEADFRKIEANRENLEVGAVPSDFAVSLPGDDPNSRLAGLEGLVRSRQYELMVEQLVGKSRLVRVQPLDEQRARFREMLANARKKSEEQADYIAFDFPNHRLRLIPGKILKTSEEDVEIALEEFRGTNVRLVPGDPTKQVLGSIHTHWLRDPVIQSTVQGTTLGGTRMGYEVSSTDVASAVEMAITVYAVDSRFIHRANFDGTRSDRLPRDLNVLVDALELFGRKRPPKL